MNITIPPHIRQELSCDESIVSSDDLRSHIARAPALPLFLTSDSTDSFLDAITDQSGAWRYEIHPSWHPVQAWEYHQFLRNGNVAITSVRIPMDQTSAPSTLAEQTLARAWVVLPDLFRDGTIPPSTVLLTWDSRVFTPLMAHTLAALNGAFGAKPTVHRHDWTASSEFHLQPQSPILVGRSPNTYLSLLDRVGKEEHIRWKYIALYRILEAGYLENILNTLQAAFFAHPTQSVAAASSSITSELRQLISLIEASTLVSGADDFLSRFNAHYPTNRFLAAIDKSLDSKQQPKAPGWQKGLSHLYNIRCSIVHSGSSGVVYDAYPDADVGCAAVIPALERLALGFLKLTY